MGAPVLQTTNVGFPPQFASKIANLFSNNQGDNVNVTAAAGDTLVAIAFGMKSYDPFDLLHGSSSAPGFLQGLNDFNANPTISDHASTTPENVNDAHLGSAAKYSLLAAAGITNTGVSVITGGNVGSFPTTTITPGAWVLTPPAVIDNANAAQAQVDALVAYNFYSGLTYTVLSATSANLSTSGIAGGNTYHAGNYSAGTSMSMPTGIILDAQGDPTATFVFKAGSTVNLASGQSVTLINGAIQQNVIWIVGSSLTTVATSTMVGTILANTSITLGGGTLNGRALAGVVTTSGAITIAAATAITVAPLGTLQNLWSLACHINLVDSDYTVSATPPTAPNPFPSSQWSLDGYYPSLYIWVCDAALAGTYNVNLNSVYQNGIATPADLAAGKPIFDGGVNFQVIKFTGMTVVAGDGGSTNVSAANPALGTPIVTTGTGDLVLAVGLQKSANALNLGPTDGTLSSQYSRITNGKSVGSEAHYLVEWGIQTGAGSWTPKFANPLGYETVIAAIAVKHT